MKTYFDDDKNFNYSKFSQEDLNKMIKQLFPTSDFNFKSAPYLSDNYIWLYGQWIKIEKTFNINANLFIVFKLQNELVTVFNPTVPCISSEDYKKIY